MNELARLAETGDLHGLMLEVNRRWAERYHPDSRFVSLMVDKGPGLPMVTEVVPLASDDVTAIRRPRFTS